MTKATSLTIVASLILPLSFSGVAAPAYAQMDWLSPHLETQRNNNARRVTERKRERGQQDSAAVQTDEQQQNTSPVSTAELQKAYNANRAEYRKRLLGGGVASADRWLEQVVRDSREPSL